MSTITFTSLDALRGQRLLGEATQSVERSFERLSSGARINRASDDAASLAISEHLRTDARTYGAALRNVNDGISALNLVDSTLQQQLGIIGRLKELASQAANGTLSLSQRASLQDEYSELLSESGRLGVAATFNGQSLLARYRGGMSQMSLQVGITSAANSRLVMNGADTAGFSGSLNAYNSQLHPSSDTVIDSQDYFDWVDQVLAGLESVLANYKAVGRTTVVDSAGNRRELLLAVSDWNSSEAAIMVAEVVGDHVEAVGTTDPTLFYGFQVATSSEGRPTSLTTESLTFDDGKTATLSLDLRGLQFSFTSSRSAIDLTSIYTANGARNALDALATREAELQQFLGQYGALASRLSAASATLTSSRENVLASESRIRDVDVAQESARLVATQIQQQVASSLLNLANQAPALALRLLKNDPVR